MRHIEKAIHYQGGVCALEIVWSLGRRHVHILNLVDENGWHFVNISISCSRRNHSLIQIQLEYFLLISLRVGA